eukprot:scaffold4967_cov116-Isochrysis_galbana.AAC.8
MDEQWVMCGSLTTPAPEQQQPQGATHSGSLSHRLSTSLSTPPPPAKQLHNGNPIPQEPRSLPTPSPPNHQIPVLPLPQIIKFPCSLYPKSSNSRAPSLPNHQIPILPPPQIINFRAAGAWRTRRPTPLARLG